MLRVVRSPTLVDDLVVRVREVRTNEHELIFVLAFGLRRLLCVVRRGGARRLDYNLWYGVDAESFSRPRYDACGIGIHGPGRVQRGSGR
jgi:hypothetical protein